MFTGSRDNACHEILSLPLRGPRANFTSFFSTEAYSLFIRIRFIRIRMADSAAVLVQSVNQRPMRREHPSANGLRCRLCIVLAIRRLLSYFRPQQGWVRLATSPLDNFASPGLASPSPATTAFPSCLSYSLWKGVGSADMAEPRSPATLHGLQQHIRQSMQSWYVVKHYSFWTLSLQFPDDKH